MLCMYIIITGSRSIVYLKWPNIMICMAEESNLYVKHYNVIFIYKKMFKWYPWLKTKQECAAQLLSYPLKNKIPLEYIIVEVMFGEIFRLPNPLCLEIAYGSIMIELCKLQPSTMPQVLAQATELLYERIDGMNKTCFDRFVNWFSYHLSNFQVKSFLSFIPN